MNYKFIEQCQKKINEDIHKAKAFEVKAISFAIAFIIAFPITFYLCCKAFGG